MTNEEKKNATYMRWVQKLLDYNCYSEEMMDDLGELLKNSPYSMKEDQGGSYDGGLLETVLNHLCVLGYHINECAFGKNAKNTVQHRFLQVNINMLMRVLLLQHIAKALMFVPQCEQWKKNKGINYDFNGENDVSLKLGEYSAYLCMKYGIALTEEEFEAMTIIDKDETKYTLSPLARIVQFANYLTNIEIRKKEEYYKNV